MKDHYASAMVCVPLARRVRPPVYSSSSCLTGLGRRRAESESVASDSESEARAPARPATG